MIALIASDPNTFIVQLFSYFLYSAPVTALQRNAFGTLALWQAVIIIAEVFVLAAVVVRIAVQLFRYGSRGTRHTASRDTGEAFSRGGAEPL